MANAQFEGAVSLNACRVEGGLLSFGFGRIHDRCVLPGLGAAPAAGPEPNRTVFEGGGLDHYIYAETALNVWSISPEV